MALRAPPRLGICAATLPKASAASTSPRPSIRLGVERRLMASSTAGHAPARAMNTVNEEAVKGRAADRRASVAIVVAILVLRLFLPPLVAGLPLRGQRALLVAFMEDTVQPSKSKMH